MTLTTFNSTTASLLERFQTARQQSLYLTEPLQAEDFVVQPMEDASPPKWHLGHVTWFFENFILANYLEEYTLFDERLNWFFNSYYESQGERILRSNRGNMTRPNTATVLAYRSHVEEHMIRLLGRYRHEAPPIELQQLIEVGIQHEQQHQELLLTDLKYTFGTNPLYPVYREQTETPALPVREPGFYKIEEGVYEIGYRGNEFSWDNEGSVHKVYLHRAELADRLVTNGEYLEFIEAGGYEDYRHWLSEGWSWVAEQEKHAPLYWYRRDGRWFEYTLNGLRELDPTLPVTHINYFEADAYAAWRGMRLPTEFEWEVVCRLQHGDSIPKQATFVESKSYHPRAAGAKDQFLGDVWEWTASAYLPYPNYPRFKGALGEYNGKFMINQMVLRGGSCATPRSHIRLTYRNFFQTDKRWQFTGIRLAK